MARAARTTGAHPARSKKTESRRLGRPELLRAQVRRGRGAVPWRGTAKALGGRTRRIAMCERGRAARGVARGGKGRALGAGRKGARTALMLQSKAARCCDGRTGMRPRGTWASDRSEGLRGRSSGGLAVGGSTASTGPSRGVDGRPRGFRGR